MRHRTRRGPKIRCSGPLPALARRASIFLDGAAADIVSAPKSQLKAEFEFRDRVDGSAYPTSLSEEEQRRFQDALHGSLRNLEAWFRENGWITGPLGRPDPLGSRAPSGVFDLPDTDLRVCVSNAYSRARSLAPAALGKRGHIEFPKHRVAGREADITHELTHVLFPNGNRMLAEGLAVYLQHKLGSNPAYPNFGKDLDQSVRELLPRLGPDSLDRIDLSSFDSTSTPDALVVKVGDEWRNSDTTYPIAGSFVGFLIEEFGADRFFKLYMRTRLVVMGRNVGDPGRWTDFYDGRTLADLAARWKRRIATAPSCTGPAGRAHAS